MTVAMVSVWVLLLSAGNPQYGVPVFAFASKVRCEAAAKALGEAAAFRKAAGPKGVATCVEVGAGLEK